MVVGAYILRILRTSFGGAGETQKQLCEDDVVESSVLLGPFISSS
jgi:hypothetical protein